MSAQPINVAKTLTDISAYAKPARDSAGGRIILAPVDFSDHSAVALRFAATTAESMQAALIVVHVIHDPAEMPGYYSSLIKSTDLERIDDIAKQAFEEFMSRVIDSNPDCPALRTAESIMVVGLPVTRILEVAVELDPIMVVMGSHGRTGLDNLIIGSKAAQIVQLSEHPVTIVKNPIKNSEKPFDD